MRKLKGIIFDVDGTLAKNEQKGHRVAFNLAFKSAGLDWVWNVDTYNKLLNVPGGKERIQYFIENYKPEFKKSIKMDSWIEKLHKEKTKYYIEILKNGKIPLRKGVKRLLIEIHRTNIKIAIATSSSLQSVLALLNYSFFHGSESWFNVIGTNDNIKAKKPAPDIYEHVLKQLELSPKECIAIEDSQSGLQSATSAGVKTIVTVNNYTAHDNFQKAELVLNNLGEPSQPCQILHGEQLKMKYLDLTWIKKLL
jgi:HAD superfamily hydrolase (TIGR01509 family)